MHYCTLWFPILEYNLKFSHVVLFYYRNSMLVHNFETKRAFIIIEQLVINDEDLPKICRTDSVTLTYSIYETSFWFHIKNMKAE